MKGLGSAALALAALLSPVNALYFFMEGPTQKCFFEELPKDTLVVGKIKILPTLFTQAQANANPGHYTATLWQEGTNSYMPAPDMGIYISVDEVFDNDHRIVSQRGSSTGRFTFSAADSGDHRLCFTPTNVPAATGWLQGGQPSGNVRFELDLAIGETSKIESSDRDKMNTIVSKVKDLNARLADIRREQVFQRVSWLKPPNCC